MKSSWFCGTRAAQIVQSIIFIPSPSRNNVLVRIYFEIFFVHWCVTICSTFAGSWWQNEYVCNFKMKFLLPRDKVPGPTDMWPSGLKHVKFVLYLAAKWILLWADPYQRCISSCPRCSCLQVMESMCLWPRVLLSAPDHPLQAWPSLSCCLT